MKHDWIEYTSLTSRRRRCKNCGATQSYGCTGGDVMKWKYGWYPKAGKCRVQENKNNETNRR